MSQDLPHKDVTRGAIRYLTERSNGGVLLPNGMDKKTVGGSGIEVLESKFPDVRTPHIS
jgi:hypothetical protein